MKKRSNLALMLKLSVLVKPLAGYMMLAIVLGLGGHLCATFITIFAGYEVLDVLKFDIGISRAVLFVCMVGFAILRAALRYGEQACNHFIAFKLLAIIRDRVFRALRRLCPAKLECREKGNLIAVITADIELLEVFYAHTISPAAIAVLFTVIMCVFIGHFHWLTGLVALTAYVVIGVAVPYVTAKCSHDQGDRVREEAGKLSSFVLDSLRGLTEIVQYGCGAKRSREMKNRTDVLLGKEE